MQKHRQKQGIIISRFFQTRIIHILIILTAPTRYTGQHAVFSLAVDRAQGSQERHLLGLYALYEYGFFVHGHTRLVSWFFNHAVPFGMFAKHFADSRSRRNVKPRTTLPPARFHLIKSRHPAA